MRRRGKLAGQVGKGLRDGGENKGLVFRSILREADTSGGAVTAPAEGGGDGVDVDFTFAAKADAKATVGRKFEERADLDPLNRGHVLNNSLGIFTFSPTFGIKLR